MTRLFLTPANAILATLLVAAGIAGLLLVPAGTMLPVHWGLDGQPDAWQPREIALLFPFIMVGLVGLLMAALRRWGEKGRAESGAHVLRAAFTAILLLAVGLESATVLNGAGYPVSMIQIVCFCLAGLLLLLGNAMPKSQPNSFAGIRIPSTMADPANWQATHRLTGGLMMLAAPVLVVAALLMAPSGWLLAIILAAVVMPILVGAIYSLTLQRDDAEAR